MVAEGDKVAVRWRTEGSFSGTGDVLGFAPNGRPIELEGADVLTVEDGKIVSNHAYTNGMVFAQQIGALPEPDSPRDARCPRLQRQDGDREAPAAALSRHSIRSRVVAT